MQLLALQLGGLGIKMSNEQKAIKLLKEIPDDMDYPTDEEFRKVFNQWYWENVAPFLKEIDANMINIYKCSNFIADPCGSSSCANCGKRRHEHE